METGGTYITQSNDCRDGLDVPRLLSPFVPRGLPSWKNGANEERVGQYPVIIVICSRSNELMP